MENEIALLLLKEIAENEVRNRNYYPTSARRIKIKNPKQDWEKVFKCEIQN